MYCLIYCNSTCYCMLMPSLHILIWCNIYNKEAAYKHELGHNLNPHFPPLLDTWCMTDFFHVNFPKITILLKLSSHALHFIFRGWTSIKCIFRVFLESNDLSHILHFDRIPAKSMFTFCILLFPSRPLTIFSRQNTFSLRISISFCHTQARLRPRLGRLYYRFWSIKTINQPSRKSVHIFRPLPDYLGSWFSLCNLISTKLDDLCQKNVDPNFFSEKKCWPKFFFGKKMLTQFFFGKKNVDPIFFRKN